MEHPSLKGHVSCSRLTPGLIVQPVILTAFAMAEQATSWRRCGREAPKGEFVRTDRSGSWSLVRPGNSARAPGRRNREPDDRTRPVRLDAPPAPTVGIVTPDCLHLGWQCLRRAGREATAACRRPTAQAILRVFRRAADAFRPVGRRPHPNLPAGVGAAPRTSCRRAHRHFPQGRSDADADCRAQKQPLKEEEFPASEFVRPAAPPCSQKIRP
jgi:hypothetical protein